jgi:hypothetical protein
VLDILSELALIHENDRGQLPNINFDKVVRNKNRMKIGRMKESGREMDVPFFA